MIIICGHQVLAGGVILGTGGSFAGMRGNYLDNQDLGVERAKIAP